MRVTIGPFIARIKGTIVRIKGTIVCKKIQLFVYKAQLNIKYLYFKIIAILKLSLVFPYNCMYVNTENVYHSTILLPFVQRNQPDSWMCVVVPLQTCLVEILSSYDPKRIIKQTPHFYLRKAWVKRFNTNFLF